MKRSILSLFVVIAICLEGCGPKKETISINLTADYHVDGQAILLDTLAYCNDAGNRFMINEIQWFISHIEIKNENNEWFPLDERGAIHYLEYKASETRPFLWQSMPQGQYTAMRFTFGLNEADNTTGAFANPPESEMFWPEPLGGGYHYMKINGKWLTADNGLSPMCIHLGIGQNAQLTEFHHNHFTVELPFERPIGQHDTSVTLSMNINNWFRNPHLYDLDEWGSGIMQNQAAQQTLKENGCDVFSLTAKSE